jgi:hypothetical protein
MNLFDEWLEGEKTNTSLNYVYKSQKMGPHKIIWDKLSAPKINQSVEKLYLNNM